MKKPSPKKRRGTALVTGASRGIGKAIASALASAGWEVTGTCRNPKRLAAENRVPGAATSPWTSRAKGAWRRC